MRTLLIILFFGVVACAPQKDETTGFVTRLGNDTLAVESFKLEDKKFHADVVVRSPRTTLTRYSAVLNPSGGIDSLKEYRFDPVFGFINGRSLVREIYPEGDSLVIAITQNEQSRTMKIHKAEEILPFIEYTHWPFELALLQTGEADTTLVPMLAGRRARDFVLANLGGENRTVRHPSRGVMDITVNGMGELETLDAGQTTRRLFVQRTTGVDVETAAKQFAKAEANGKGFGALSGAVEEEFEVGGVKFQLTYGSPSKRGRDLFGGIVPYGQRWRTGANRATHIKFDKDIMIGDIDAPAAEYTLFSIPEENGGTLIINKQTGQNGRSYSQEMDLGRIQLNREVNSEEIESFTITVSETEQGGRLNLMWGNTIYFVDLIF